MTTTALVFRGPNGAPDCPECLQPASIQHFRLPLYGHYCITRRVNTYWTTLPSMVFLSITALIEILDNGDEDDAV